jgi:hypothetical protein
LTFALLLCSIAESLKFHIRIVQTKFNQVEHEPGDQLGYSENKLGIKKNLMPQSIYVVAMHMTRFWYRYRLGIMEIILLMIA